MTRRPGRTRIAALLPTVCATLAALTLALTGTAQADAATRQPAPAPAPARQAPPARSSGTAARVWAGTANGTAVQLYDCNGTAAQQWRAGAGSSLRDPASGRSLDATGNSSADGTRLQLRDCTAGANQAWKLPG
ncbi:Ricin-type beta-trefoil lectin domain-containing protein [Streptomyces sp. DvalAA-14]|uniref:RICIN domain-containing protein n=1 Tax=unclassified Streptomyces TaxID=2593676 RepID=UPI00081B3E55|nr:MULTISPECIES: RICIN domain-containing protein [unclassified Streptomyces]MYS24614.1 hypothetical protein [Streptomyces sp. SID4948]SCE47739.1 Ricin-type beta-trefoil lectin domain-containing protein [Streptomyces sp. DvalAA-14]